MSNKLYQSEKWLRYHYLRLRKSPEEIAKMCDCTPMTIYRALKQYGLRR